ncbi:uncharacterized protein N7500_007055, partial [Penicillium coprophilum]|uniref:uncharacterized protein n=1 Tax=Penicillium coprophilum TaxID=36646 RepID=UPI00239CD0D9
AQNGKANDVALLCICLPGGGATPRIERQIDDTSLSLRGTTVKSAGFNTICLTSEDTSLSNKFAGIADGPVPAEITKAKCEAIPIGRLVEPLMLRTSLSSWRSQQAQLLVELRFSLTAHAVYKREIVCRHQEWKPILIGT